ncbi:MAG TPA: hypothetical protein VFU19_12615 [Iamia sp.]|nr:hypothetical protein [Iamia sp.]
MPADKDAAKRRRQARNRQERQNRQARTEGAKRAATRPSRTVEETPTRAKAKSGGTTNLAKEPARPAASSSGGLLGKLFPPRPTPGDGADGGDARPARAARPARPPSEVVEVPDVPGPRGLLLRLTAQPGGRAAVLALLVAVVSAATLFVAPVAPPAVLDELGAMVVVHADGGDALDPAALEEVKEDEFADEPVVAAYRVGLLDLVPPVAAAIYALVPVLIAFMGVRSLTRFTRTRTLMICAVTGVLYVVMLGPIGIFFLLGAIALGFGAYQSAKADKAAAAAAA